MEKTPRRRLERKKGKQRSLRKNQKHDEYYSPGAIVIP